MRTRPLFPLLVGTLTAALFLFAGTGRSETRRKAPQVASLELEGCEKVGAKTLRALLETRAPRWHFWKSEYQADVFEKDLQRITRYYRRRGYLQAEIEDKETRLDKDGSSVHLRVWIYEGPRSSIQKLDFEGVSALPPQRLVKVLSLRSGDPFDRDLLDTSLRRVVKVYTDEGYLDVEVKPLLTWNADRTLATVTVQVKEGARALLAGYTIQGLERTRDWVVWREFRTHIGDPIRWNRVESAQQRLYLTGIFQTMYVKTLPPPAGHPTERRLAVEVQENKARDFNLSGGWGSVDRFHGQAEYGDLNMYGRGRKVGLKASASRILQRVEGNYGTPWTAGFPWFNNVNVFGELKSQPGYDLRRVGGILTVGKNFSPVSKFQVSYQHVNAYLAHVQVIPAPDTNKDFVRSFTASVILDRRDSFTDAQEGTYLVSSAEMSGSFFHGTDTFLRLTQQARWYHRLLPGTVIASALDAGWVGNYKSRDPITLSQLFFAGGPNALRGFAYNCAGPLDAQGLPTGGQFKLVLNAAEVRQHLWKFLGVVGFWDVGNVFSNIDRFRFRELRTVGGWGLRVTTRLGVLRADQGFIVNPRPGERRQRIYISIGQAF